MSVKTGPGKKETRLSIVFPEIARQWHKELNSDFCLDSVTAGSNKKVWWQCTDNSLHVWQQMVEKRVRAGGICSQCVAEEKCLAKRFPEIAAQWHDELNGELKPQDVAARGSDKVWWQCQRAT